MCQSSDLSLTITHVTQLRTCPQTSRSEQSVSSFLSRELSLLYHHTSTKKTSIIMLRSSTTQQSTHAGQPPHSTHQRRQHTRMPHDKRGRTSHPRIHHVKLSLTQPIGFSSPRSSERAGCPRISLSEDRLGTRHAAEAGRVRRRAAAVRGARPKASGEGRRRRGMRLVEVERHVR